MLLKQVFLQSSLLKRRWVKGLIGISLSFFILAGGGIFYLSRGPLEISPSFVTFFKKQIGFSIQFKKLELVYESWRHPVALSMEDILLGEEKDLYQLEVKKARITFKMMALLKRKILPTSITLLSPLIRVKKNFEEASNLEAKILEEEKTLLEMISLYFLHPLHEGAFKKLRDVTIEGGTIFMGDHTDDLSLSRMNAFLSRDREEIRGNVSFHLEKGQTILPCSHQISYNLQQRFLNLKTEVDKLILSDWIAIPGFSFKAPLKGLIHLSLPLTAPEKIEGQVNLSFQKGELEIENKASFLRKPLLLEEGHFKIVKKGSQIILEKGLFKVGDPVLSLKGSLQVSEETLRLLLTHHPLKETLPLCLEGTLENVKFQNLSSLWPEGLAPLVRSWVLKNIAVGDVPFASLSLRGDLGASLDSLSVHQLGGQISLQGATLDYITHMPLIKDIEGLASFNKETFNIKISKGSYKNLKITEGMVSLQGLHEKDQKAHIQLTLQGPLKETIELIDHKPLFFIQKLGAQLEDVKGQVQGLLTFQFPLETTLAPSQIVATSEATTSQAGCVLVLDGTKYTLKGGDLKLLLNGGKLVLKGPMEIDGVSTSSEWVQDFIKDHTLFRTEASVMLQDLKKYGFSQEEIQAEGKVPLQVTYTGSPTITPCLEISGSLKDARIRAPSLNWTKPVGEPQTFSATLKMTPEKALSQVRARLQGLKTKVEMKAVKDKEGRWGSFSLSPFQLGRHDFHLTFGGKGKKVLSIKGNSLDLEPFWSKDFYDSEKSFFDPYPSVEAHVSLEKVHFSEKDQIYRVIGSSTWNRKMWRSFNFKGFFKSLSQKEDRSVMIDLKPTEKGEKLVLKSKDAGSLLQLLGITDDVRKGDFLLEGERLFPASSTSRKNYEMKGHLFVKDFYVLNVGLMAQLLSLALLTSMLDLVSGKGIYFIDAWGDFSQKNHLLTLEKLKASGVSLGFTCEGMINQKSKEIHLRGLLIPAHFLNQAISQIPLLGPLLSGGQGCILGTSYSITGTTEKPQINVNPLTTFTPGFICGLFKSGEKPTVAE